MFQKWFYWKSTQREIGHSKGSPRVLQGHLGTRALEEHLGNPRALEQLGTQCTCALGHSNTRGIRGIEGHLGTRALKALGQLGTQALEGNLDIQPSDNFIFRSYMFHVALYFV